MRYLFLLLPLLIVLASCNRTTHHNEPTPVDFESLITEIQAELVRKAKDAQSVDIERWFDRPRSELVRRNLRHTPLLQDLYATRSYRPVWLALDASGSQLSEAGLALYETLASAERDHGLFAEDLALREMSDILKTFDQKSLLLPMPDLTATQSEAIVKLAGKMKVPDLAMHLSGENSPVPQIGVHFQTYVEALRLQSAEEARLDLLLSDALVEYGLAMRWSNSAWHREVQWHGELADDASWAAADLSTARSLVLAGDALKEIFEAPELVTALLRILPPPFQEYERLQAAFQKYQGFVEAGGWDVLPDDAEGLRRGSEGELVKALQMRLMAEEYYDGELHGRFDAVTRNALLRYQHTHQLWEEGYITRETLQSLNVTAERRTHQVRNALQRWRESPIGPDEHYVRVNVPDFHAEVVRRDEPVMRFKVVTGSTTRRAGVEGFPSATPIFSSSIEHVVFNPYWNVPNSIRRRVLEPKFAENPDYFEEEGFTIIHDENGVEILRQLPGPKNALGEVKFMFPNNHSVFLHDTPEKQWFRWPVRAFSQGCVRIENPMEFAQYLLGREGNYDQSRVDAWMQRDTETWIRLQEPVPIHIDYVVVRADKEGQVHFLADIYRHDQPRLAQIERRIAARRANSHAEAHLVGTTSE